MTTEPQTTDREARRSLRPHDRRTHKIERAVVWCLAPFVDSWSGLSLNRFLAVLFALAATHGRFAHDVPLTAWDVALATLAGSLGFGKDVFVAFLDRKKEEA